MSTTSGVLSTSCSFTINCSVRPGDVFDPLFTLLVAELPEQQERNEHEREGEQDVGLNNVQEVQDQGLNFTILFGSSRLCELTSLTARCQAAP